MLGKKCYCVCFFTYLSTNLIKLLCVPQVVLTLGVVGLMDKARCNILLMARIINVKLIVKLLYVFISLVDLNLEQQLNELVN
jgi:hypothetical protein